MAALYVLYISIHLLYDCYLLNYIALLSFKCFLTFLSIFYMFSSVLYFLLCISFLSFLYMFSLSAFVHFLTLCFCFIFHFTSFSHQLFKRFLAFLCFQNKSYSLSVFYLCHFSLFVLPSCCMFSTFVHYII